MTTDRLTLLLDQWANYRCDDTAYANCGAGCVYKLEAMAEAIKVLMEANEFYSQPWIKKEFMPNPHLNDSKMSYYSPTVSLRIDNGSAARQARAKVYKIMGVEE